MFEKVQLSGSAIVASAVLNLNENFIGGRNRKMRREPVHDREGMLSKVPEVTIYFWIIKILCTTVGETASDFMNISLNLGLTGTSIAMGILFFIVLFIQIKAKKYIPSLYWSTVVLISIFGTLVTDIMTDEMDVPLEASTIFFSGALALTFSIWFLFEKTLSIHSIFTFRREAFYWLAILFTFALGTASGDLMAEKLGLGYLVTGIIVCSVIITVFIAWRLNLDPILSFWIAYIMTRPLGASLGDYLSQATANGGLGLGATLTSVFFLSAILLTVLFLSFSRRDVIAGVPSANVPVPGRSQPATIQVIFTITMLLFLAGFGYQWQRHRLQLPSHISTASGNSSDAASSFGDLSVFKTITGNTLDSIHTCCEKN